MHIQLETLPNCITSMRVELTPERVAQERQNILRNYQGAARLPGYRPGKAPHKLIEAKYKKEIAEELQRKLVTAGTREAIAEKKLKVLSVSEVEQVEMGQDNTLRFTAKLVTAPEFELPPYQNLPVKLPPAEITDADVDVALERLRSRMADFNDIEGRGVAMEDFCVIDFAGRFEGKPVSEEFPNVPKELAGRENFWIKLGPKTLLPGFPSSNWRARRSTTP
jgi:trigger factor